MESYTRPAAITLLYKDDNGFGTSNGIPLARIVVRRHNVVKIRSVDQLNDRMLYLFPLESEIENQDFSCHVRW